MLNKIPTSNYDQHCTGYQNPENNNHGYVLGVCLSTGTAPISFKIPGSEMLDRINAFDVAEATGSYLGQINMIEVSSFCGSQGLIWGMDIAKHPDFDNKKDLQIGSLKRNDGVKIPVYSAKPLLEATAKLLGTKDKKRFPILPGSHVPCATKKIVKEGPCHLYCALAIGIPEDRTFDACLLMEDIGELDNQASDKKSTQRAINQIALNAATSVLKVGENQNIKYKEVFVSVANTPVKKGDIGCALIAAPYLSLAKKALPEKASSLASMRNITLDQWEKATAKSSLSAPKKNVTME